MDRKVDFCSQIKYGLKFKGIPGYACTSRYILLGQSLMEATGIWPWKKRKQMKSDMLIQEIAAQIFEYMQASA